VLPAAGRPGPNLAGDTFVGLACFNQTRMSARLRIMPFADDGPPAEAPVGEELERAALAGDTGAWSELISRHQHKVLVAILARGVPLERAREIAQETWLRLMEQQRAGRLDSLVLPGLAIVQAGFLAANDRRRGTLPALFAHQPESAAPASAEESVIGRERLARVQRALADCPAGARRVFELVYDHPELGYAEVASRVGLSVQRVKQVVFEVRQRLRGALAEGEES
jgi:DNA-directed RNA polymerase specialized sigma24 family protein